MKYHPDQNQDNKGKHLFDHCLVGSYKFYTGWCNLLLIPFCGIYNIWVLSFAAELAEAKFKEVMTSYEAIKTERKNNKAWARKKGMQCVVN